MNDVKELIGTIMRVLDGAEITEAEVLDLGFDADGEAALAVVNDAYIRLLEFVYDRDRRRADPVLDKEQRTRLQESLEEIARVSKD